MKTRLLIGAWHAASFELPDRMEQRTCKEDVKEVASAERIARVTQIVYEKHVIPNNRAGRPRRVTYEVARADAAFSQPFPDRS